MSNREIGIIQSDKQGNKYYLGRVRRKLHKYGGVEIAGMRTKYEPLMTFGYRNIEKIRDVEQIEYKSHSESIVSQVAVLLHEKSHIDLEEEHIEHLHNEDKFIVFDYEGHTGRIIDELSDLTKRYADFLADMGDYENSWTYFKFTNTDMRLIKTDLREEGQYEFVEEQYGFSENGLIQYYKEMEFNPSDLNVGYIDYETMAQDDIKNLGVEALEYLFGEIMIYEELRVNNTYKHVVITR